MAEKKPKRTRNWVLIVYPDSAPENWQEILGDLHTPVLISPLHDRDINPDGELKKPHWHVILIFDGLKSYEQILEVAQKINAATPQVVNNIRGHARYLTHMDNPEKAQYSIDDVIALSGADYRALCALASDKYNAIGEMQDWCDEQGVRSYAQLSRYARSFRNDWWRILCDSGSMQMMAYLKSSAWEDSLGKGDFDA